MSEARDLYHIWFDLRREVRDTELAEAVDAYLGKLKAEGRIAGWRLTRCKLGLAPDDMPEFHLMIEVTGLAQLDEAFRVVSERSEPVESFHHAVNSKVRNVKFALYRDFPDPWRATGEEKF